MRARYTSTCPACGGSIFEGEEILRDPSHGGAHAHASCVERREPFAATLDEHYNALCELLDRIMTGNGGIRVTGGARSSIAETLRTTGLTEADYANERTIVRFDHDRIRAWSEGSLDRTMLVLALNVHELGHIWHTPALSLRQTTESPNVVLMFNTIEDARQEMLTTLFYPKTLDYLRFLNARALARAIEDRRGGLRSGYRGQLYFSFYGRRHLFPKSINDKLRETAKSAFGLPIANEIERLIDEFMTLYLPDQDARAWEIATRLAVFADSVGGVGPLALEDPRHDCLPVDGKPGVNPAVSSALTRKLRELLSGPSRVPEPSTERDAGKAGNAEKSSGAKAEGDSEASNNAASTVGDDAGAEDADADWLARAGKGSNDDRRVEPHDPLLRTLRALEDLARERVADELGERHKALKASGQRPSLGGGRHAGLQGSYVDAARRLAHLFREINQDLAANTERAQRRGRLDVRRLPTALATGSPRIFKRRLRDISPEAALGVHIMIDTSGSMLNRFSYGENETRRSIDIALPAGFTLARGVEMAGHLAKVTTYSDTHVLHKNWLDEQYRPIPGGLGGGTDPSSALELVELDFHYLQREKEIRNHVLIIITDGQWTGVAVNERLLTQIAKSAYVIEIGIGVLPVPVKGAWEIMSIPDVAGIAKAMSRPLAKLAIEIAKNARRRIA